VKSIEELQRPQIRFLDHVLRILIAAGQPTRKIERRVKVRQHQCLEAFPVAGISPHTMGWSEHVDALSRRPHQNTAT
jgi:hypothetical protein